MENCQEALAWKEALAWAVAPTPKLEVVQLQVNRTAFLHLSMLLCESLDLISSNILGNSN